LHLQDAFSRGRLTSSGAVDPNISADYSNEFVVSLDRQLMPGFALTASYIWRPAFHTRPGDADAID
jgi:hypothetical protein